MYSEEWIVKATLVGDFCLLNSENLQGEKIPGLLGIVLSPEMGKEGHQTGLHTLEVRLCIPPRDGGDNIALAIDSAREAVSRIATRIAVSSGRAVVVAEGMSVLQYVDGDSSRGRAIVTGSGAHLAAPTPVATAFLAAAAQPSLERAMHWWAHSLRIPDPADSLHALFVALDLIAAPLKPPVSRKRKCKDCGFVEALQPGLREKVVYFLTERGGLSQSLAEEIYETRNALTHGGVSVSEEMKRVLRQHAGSLRVAIRKEFAAKMNCELPPLPNFFPFDLQSAHLLVEFKDDNKQSKDRG